MLPAALATILLFLDQQITAVIVNRKENKLKVWALVKVLATVVCGAMTARFYESRFIKFSNFEIFVVCLLTERMRLPFRFVCFGNSDGSDGSLGTAVACGRHCHLHQPRQFIETRIRDGRTWWKARLPRCSVTNRHFFGWSWRQISCL